MDVLLAGLKWNSCLVYLDDIIIFSKTIPQHLQRLEAVLKCLYGANLKLKLSKCTFGATSLKILGYVVSGAGISPDPAKVEAMSQFPRPCSLKAVQSFIGLCSYYRRFIKNFAVIARPLIDLTKKGHAFIWSNEHELSFITLQTALLSPPILGHPNYNLPMEVHCDACSFGIGAVLVQQQADGERVLSYASRLLSSAERNYSITEQECLALVWSLQKFKIFVWGTKIKVITDHHALCWLMRKKDLAGRLARWSLQLQDLDIDIIYRSGRLHVDADVLSRHPIGPPEAEAEIPMLLCQPAFLSLPGSLNISQLQQDSNWWRKIIEGLKNPNPDCSTRRETRNFLLINDVLYHRVVFRGRASQQLCVPPELVNQVLLACHDDITAGHLGVSKTLFKVNQRFFWPKRTKEVAQYVRSCIECQSKKKDCKKDP
jgi:hypothetical protein